MTGPITASRYQVLTQLARGGMGEILLARRLGAAGFERLVVLKRPLHVDRSPETVRALIDEARLLAQIHHPNVCHVYDLEEADGDFFFVMEFLHGVSLWAFLERSDRGGRAEPVPPRVLCALFEQACDGLSAIHGVRGGESGVVHRDISPSNVFVTRDGVVKILDLGIARSAEPESAPRAPVRGKLPYCSPEQLAGGRLDARADVFALGLVLHDVARGERPAREVSGAERARTLDLAALPPGIAAIVGRAAARDPDDRFASADAMLSALRQAATAHGGPLARSELAAWHTDRFARELAQQRAIVDRATGTIVDDAPTQVLILHPATGGLTGGPGTDAVPSSTIEDPLPHATERLTPVPARKSDPMSEVSGRRTRRHIVFSAIAIALVGAAAIVLAANRRSGGLATPAPTATDSGAAQHVDPQNVDARETHAEHGPAPAYTRPIASATPAEPASAKPTTPAKTARRHVERPAPAPREADVALGSIRIDSQPSYATIDIDGRRIGATPIKSWKLPAGRHRVHARCIDGREQDREVEIRSDEQTILPLTW
jgi:serine/threonine-protein kinase